MSVLWENITKSIEKGYIINDDNSVYYNNKERKLFKDRKGYLYFTIRNNNKLLKIYIHKSIALKKFSNKVFDKNIVIRHLDGNKENNLFSNIEIGTQSDNILDINQEKRLKNSINASQKIRKFTNNEIDSIIKDKNNGFSYKELINKYGATKSFYSYLFNKMLINNNSTYYN